MIKSILIANRGEIAVRIIKAAKKLGIKTVQVFSEVDKESLAVKLADSSINIGSSIASKSYLNIEVIVNAAIEVKVDAIHPGYGFLSENAKFAEAVEKAGLIFIGPKAEVISRLGDKVQARILADSVGVPTVPGSNGKLKDISEAVKVADRIGFPVMIKALAGGGGKGIRIVHNREVIADTFLQAQNEAKSVFGDGGLYMEKYISKARHIEVQILGDGENFIHFYERECSIQRRRQKVWEEAPAVNLDENVRARMCEKALDLVREVNYTGAATVEYIYDDVSNEFYFIETNTRIQVEHPITEMITGVDLVAEMIKIASGIPLSIKQQDVKINGHAIECRINAEDSDNNFLPSPGKIEKLGIPDLNNVRFDTFIYEGYTIPMFYDSLIGKLIIHGDTRSETIEKLRDTLDDLNIEGVKTTIPLHIKLAQNKDVLSGATDTQFLEKLLK
ncbi:acetyl-CoA carboxylase, biotin carboxylase subunit [Tenacibaculum sp. MAR_2009_124]|uniref:acetyl-CoA carboxylase biotin carboxylase subunit n=1 Tax=Tenacibaculum sp. MAR_2009_124 TaxID=1250059 RepID=UPI00089463BA|nr:acetyl-CoA carboxylase biotin carboxylase subunit [Tenacibaculum sp. MAR_2009_124]SEC93838.1 acetyl-CoA carboxylase, biotin carboxylase subunit [Tenacibaculum sp. MAR_2009_124]